MPKFYDSKGQSYDLTHQIGRGGEGTVFACPNDLNLVAKIYHEPIDAEKAEKLKWMAENKNDQLLKVAAWIVDTLHDAEGTTVGFLMPNVRAKEIHELYSLKSRRVHFPHATWKFLLHTATNVARAFYSLHKNSHIMGDVNHGNCVVLRDGTVKLIDCDSYSISRGDFRYTCEVGVATHLAPELQGVDLGEIEREEKHDNFGLAVIIFQLLFLGRHPFAGNYLGAEDKSLEDCIREQRFAYGERAITRNVKQPPGTLSLGAVSPRIAEMFERAFLSLKRPEPREWIEALEDLSESLKQCGLHVGHFYFQELKSCPWCALETQTGVMLFPFVGGAGANANGEEAFNIFTIESLVASFNVPQNLPVKPQKSHILPPPSPEADKARRENLTRFITLAIVQFCIVIFLTALGGPGIGFFIGALLMAGFIVTLNNSGKNTRIDLEIKLENARREWNQIETEWTGADVLPKFNNNLAMVRQKINEHHSIQQQSREKVKLLHDQVFKYNLDVYLSSFKIGDAKIAGVSDGHLNRLKNMGIRSAADVEANSLKSLPPPIADEIGEKIVDWRENLERAFVYNPDIEVPESEQKRLMDGFTAKRGRIEREIENLLVSLRSGSTVLQQRQQTLAGRAEKTGRELLQNESDLAAAGSITPAIVVLILITTLIPMFGNAFSSAKPARYGSSPSTYGSGAYSEPKVKAVPDNYSSSSSSNSATINNVYAYTLPDNLTDKEFDDLVKTLSDGQKASGSEQLLDQANALAGAEKYEAAKVKLQRALKLEPEEVRILNKLSEILYKQEDYTNAMIYLNRSLVINPQFIETKSLLGNVLLKKKYYEDAQKIFSDLIKQNPRSFESQFSLGLAYKGLDRYYSAVEAFRAATELRSDDVEARYNYAVCLNKVGSPNEVVEQYQILLSINEKKAEQLRKDLGLKNVPKIAVKPPAGNGSGFGSGNGVREEPIPRVNTYSKP